MIELPIREIHAKVLVTDMMLRAMREAGTAQLMDTGVREGLYRRGCAGHISISKLMLPTGQQVTWAGEQPYTDGALRWE